MADIGKIQPREIVEEMRESYLDYAMSVIVSRALPDVRDGLKPVHRRILFAMHELGLTHGAKYMKSARVVGECFVKDTLVATQRGLIPIQEIMTDDLVFTQSGLKPVRGLYRMPSRPLRKITLSHGISLSATESQKLKTFNSSGALEWKEAKDLQSGDWMVVRSVYPKLPKVPLSSLQGKRKNLNKNIAYIIGLLISDGWVTSDYSTKKYRRLGFCSSELSIMQRLAHCFLEEFGYMPTICNKEYDFVSKKGEAHKNNIFTVRINRKDINEYLIKELEIPADFKAAAKYIPAKILRSPKEVIFSFISGLIDGDGSIAKVTGYIHYGSVSEQLINQLQILLQQLGIFGKKYSQKSPGIRGVINGRSIRGRAKAYSLEVTGIEAQKLARELSLTSTKKNKRLEVILNADPSRLWSDFGLIPFGSKMIFTELSQNHRGGGWYTSIDDGKKFRMGINYPNGTKIRYSKDLMERPLRLRQITEFGIAEKLNRIGSPIGDLIASVGRGGISFLQISEVESVGAEETYDIQVADDHEFLANGVIAHNCLGKYHPHGDIAVYDSLVRMAQDFSLRYPLIDGQGNFGSIDGDSAAAMRYSEAKMTRLAEEMLRDIEKDTVDFRQNYDNTREEPTVLPARIPNLLLNGTLGIAVGMATNIPPHNLGEVTDALIHLIEHPQNGSHEEIMQFIKGPDFPTGGIIFDEKAIREAYASGRGAVLTRGRAEIQEGPKNSSQIVVTEIPYQVNKAELIETIANMVQEKRLEGIRDIRDESDKDDAVRIVMELKQDAHPQKVLNNLYKHTDLEKSFNLNMLALVGGIQPQVLSIKEVLEEFLKHREIVVTRRTKFDLARAKERIHILEGLKKALDHIDRVIETIKKSRDREEAHGNLIKKFALTEIQASAILEMRLATLAGLERQKIEDELKEKLALAKSLEAMLKDPRKIMEAVKKELQETKEKYGDERKTAVIKTSPRELSDEDLIPDEEVAVVLTRSGYIKRIKPEQYRMQKRGGKGLIGMETKEEDVVEHLLTCSTHADLLFFTDSGKVYQVKTYEIPEGVRTSKGKAIFNFLSLNQQEKITSLLAVAKSQKKQKQEGAQVYIVMVTKNGIIKKAAADSFENVRKSGLIAITLKNNDALRWAKLTKGEDQLLLVTKNGQSIRFAEKDVRSMGRQASGVTAMRLKKQDEVMGMDVIPNSKLLRFYREPPTKSGQITPILSRAPDEVGTNSKLLVVMENGYGKQTLIKHYKKQRRGGSGIKTAKVTPKTGKVVGTRLIETEEELIAISRQGQVIRTSLSAIPVLGRATQGVRIMKMGQGDGVASITTL